MTRALSLLERVETLAATLAYTCVAALLIGDVLSRELFGVTVLGIQKIAVYATIVSGFLGLAMATASGKHLRPEIFDRLTPRGYDALANRLSDGFAAVFHVVLAAVAAQFVAVSAEAGDKAAIFFFVLWPIQIVMPLAFLSCAIRHAAFALRPALKPKG